jgi:hypothetical protein
MKLLHDPLTTTRWVWPAIFLTCATATPAAPPEIPFGLPELPTVEERHPEVHDKYGCHIGFTPENKAHCRTQKAEEKAKSKAALTTAEREKLLASPEKLNYEKVLRGFSGPYYTPLPSANAAVVLGETVTTSATPSGNFTAVGLVRNETLEPITAVTVTAKLLNKGGRVLAQENTQALVEPLRPGEPGPFQLTSPVAFKDVAQVQWSAEWRAEEDKSKLAWRDVEIIGRNWGSSLPWGNRDRDDHDTAAVPPYPHLEIGHVKNLSGKDIPNPRMVMAWFKEITRGDGPPSSRKLVAVTTAPLYEWDDHPHKLRKRQAKVLEGMIPSMPKDCPVLACGGSQDYVIEVVDQKLARSIEEWKIFPMHWVTGE